MPKRVEPGKYGDYLRRSFNLAPNSLLNRELSLKCHICGISAETQSSSLVNALSGTLFESGEVIVASEMQMLALTEAVVDTADSYDDLDGRLPIDAEEVSPQSLFTGVSRKDLQRVVISPLDGEGTLFEISLWDRHDGSLDFIRRASKEEALHFLSAIRLNGMLDSLPDRIH